MTTPRTELDTRFSEPGAEPTSQWSPPDRGYGVASGVHLLRLRSGTTLIGPTGNTRPRRAP